MSCLSENICYLIWETKKHIKNQAQSYSDYIDELASKCLIDIERFRGIITGKILPSKEEIGRIIDVFSVYDNEAVPHINEDFIYRSAIISNKNQLLQENIQYLLNSIPWGENQIFLEKVGVQASTLTRWKNGSMKPSKYYLKKICRYFDINDPEKLEMSFLFYGLSAATVVEKKIQLKKLIDNIDPEKLEAMYPAVLKLLE